MKQIFLLTAFTIMLLASAAQTNNVIKITGTRFPFEIMQHWINVYQQTHPGEVGSTLTPAKWWKFYLGGNIYHYGIKGALFNGTVPVDNKSWIYSLKTNFDFRITPTFSAQLNVNYLSKKATAQGEDSYFLSPNSSIRKTFLNGRLAAVLQWQNMDARILKSNRQRITTWGKNFYTTTNYIVETDVVVFNLSFNLRQNSKKIKLPTSEFGEKEF